MSKKVTIRSPKKPTDPQEWVNNREGNKRLTIDLPASLHTKLKIYCAKENKTMGQTIKELLESNLKN